MSFGETGDEAMVRRIASAVVEETTDRNAPGRARAVRGVGQHHIEELVVFQSPVGNSASVVSHPKLAVRCVEVRALRRKVIVEEAADGDRP